MEAEPTPTTVPEPLSTFFISYRRDDAPAAASRIREALLGALQKRHPSMDSRAIEDAIFMDVHGIGAGRSFASVIEEKVEKAMVVIAVIGPRWHGRRRLWRARIHQTTDWVRRELELAYTLPIAVLPVRVDGARALEAEELPASLRYLTTLQTPDLRHDRWGVDVADFVESAIAAGDKVRVAPHTFDEKNDDLMPDAGGRPALRWLLGVGFLALFAGSWLVWKPTEANPTIVATPATPSATIAVDDKNNNLLKVGAFHARQLALAADGTPKIGTDGLPQALGRTAKGEFTPRKYAMAVTALSKLTGLDFGYLAQYDVTRR